MARRSLAHFAVLTVFVTSVNAQGIDKPPRFTEPLSKETRNAIPKENVTLVCLAEAKPAATFWWTLNEMRINQSSSYLLNDGTLHITGFRSENAGNYQCFAENIVNGNRAVAMSSVITIREAVVGGQWLSHKKLKTTTKKEGEYLNFRCKNPPECVPTGHFSWNKVSEASISGEGKGQVKNSKRKYIDNEGTLHFIYLKTEDSSGELTYKCGLHNSVLEIIKLGNDRKLQVNNNPDGLVNFGATNRFSTNQTKFIRLRSAELECVFSGYPIPTITWRDKGKNNITGNTEKYTLSDFNRKLGIRNLQEEDEGKYYCEGMNELNTEEIEIFLNVTSGPIWEKSLSSQTRPEGTDAVFTCKARPALNERPLDAPIWFINGEKIDNAGIEGKMEFSDNFQVLTVKNLNKKTDIKCFQCNVSNEIGYEMGDGCLNVIKPIVVTSRPALEQVVEKGELVNLTVTATTDPDMTLEYKWKYNNIIYINSELPPFVVFNSTSFEAYINTSALTDEEFLRIAGTYHRELYHRYETKTVSITVKLRIQEKVDDVSNAGAIWFGNLWWLVVIVALLVLIIFVVAYAVSRAGEKGTYPLDRKERACHMDPERDIAAEGLHDLSMAPDENNFPNVKLVNPSFDRDDDMPNGDEENLEENSGYDQDMSNFSEDGSFIGQYSSEKQ